MPSEAATIHGPLKSGANHRIDYVAVGVATPVVAAGTSEAIDLANADHVDHRAVFVVISIGPPAKSTATKRRLPYSLAKLRDPMRCAGFQNALLRLLRGNGVQRAPPIKNFLE